MTKSAVLHYTKMFLHIIGYATLIGMAYATCLMFYAMASYGYFHAYEPDVPTLYFEIAITIYGVAFLLYLLFKYVRTNIWKKRE